MAGGAGGLEVILPNPAGLWVELKALPVAHPTLCSVGGLVETAPTSIYGYGALGAWTGFGQSAGSSWLYHPGLYSGLWPLISTMSPQNSSVPLAEDIDLR